MADDSSGTNWLKVILAAYAANQNQKANQKAAKQMSGPQTTSVTSFKTPYMNPQLQAIMPYIMSEANRIYQSRQNFAGGHPADFSPFATQLAGMKPEDWLKGMVGGAMPINTNQAAYTGPGTSIGGGGSVGVGSGSLSDLNARGAALDPLTDEQHRANAYEVSADDLKKLASGLAGIAPALLTGGVGAGMKAAATPLIDKLWNSIKGAFTHDDSNAKPEDNYSGMLTDKYISDALTNANPQFKLNDGSSPTMMDRKQKPGIKFGPAGVNSGYIYQGTASPYDWGDGTGGGNNWAGGGSIWDIFGGGELY